MNTLRTTTHDISKGRDTLTDAAKGFCMLLIICIHAEVFGVVGMPITFLAVPMFFLMSGFYDRAERPVGTWMPKALRTLILPAVIWVILGQAYLEVLGYAKNHTFAPWPLSIYHPADGNGPAWFLFALLYAKILTWALCKLRTPKAITICISLIIGKLGGGYRLTSIS